MGCQAQALSFCVKYFLGDTKGFSSLFPGDVCISHGPALLNWITEVLSSDCKAFVIPWDLLKPGSLKRI